ncbi:unnamed protein product [marine sediment metagenome]|uniref:Uncharacterized protein n=1 Tax=marine sediment metagenome TaxID=412755 RepID=X0ZEC8_9ZZZZ
MTKAQIKAEIATIRRCEKAIYDYQQRHNEWDERVGLYQAYNILRRKRKRLGKKLKNESH